jgi:hypothetical protein
VREYVYQHPASVALLLCAHVYNHILPKSLTKRIPALSHPVPLTFNQLSPTHWDILRTRPIACISRLAPERRPSTLLPHNTGGNISTSIIPLSPSPTLHALRNLWRRCALIYRSWPVWTTISDIYVIARACLNRRQRIVESLCTGFGFHQEDNSRGDV